METRKQFKARLQESGLWEDFLARREELQADGNTATTANKIARSEFGPADDEEPEKKPKSKPKRKPPVKVESVPADVFADRPSVSARKVVQWVFNSIDLDDLKPEDAPSAGAWSLLMRLRRYPDLLKEFYRTIWSKMLPTRSEIERTERFEDDGREQLDIIDKLERSRAEQ